MSKQAPWTHGRTCETQSPAIQTSPVNSFDDIYNSFWPSDAIWRYRSWSTWDLIMACCLMAPSHYLNLVKWYWLSISKALWHSPESNFTASAQGTVLYNELMLKVFTVYWKYIWHVVILGNWNCQNCCYHVIFCNLSARTHFIMALYRL